MADKSAIEWTDATWNPIVGCSILSPGCTHCYAMGMAARIEAMTAALRKDGKGGAPHYDGTTRKVNGNTIWTGKLALAPERILTEPLRWTRPRRIFVNSMGDLFHEDVPTTWIDHVFATMALAPQHTFQVLTKRASRMREYCDNRGGGVSRRISKLAPMTLIRWPLHNVWLGVSAERQQEANERIPDLLGTSAAIRFVSAEPLLGPISFRWAKWQPIARDAITNELDGLRRLDWIIVGGESGPNARPMHPAWARSIRDQCQAAGVPFFFKQWGAWAPMEHSEAADEAGWQGRGEWMILDQHGELDIPDHRWPDEEVGEVAVIRLGKKAAGRLLDGKEHNGMPELREVPAL